MIYELRDKQVQLVQAMRLSLQFCEVNEIQEPLIDYGVYSRHNCGWYNHGRRSIHIAMDSCSVFRNNPRAWTCPGYTADLTVIGVLTHELGHHWHMTHQSGTRELAGLFRKQVTPFENPVTSYGERNTGEAIAESFKVFVTDPTLLLAIAPFHYGFFLRHGLKPVVESHFENILSHSPRHLRAANNKAKESARRCASMR